MKLTTETLGRAGNMSEFPGRIRGKVRGRMETFATTDLLRTFDYGSGFSTCSAVCHKAL